MTLPTLGFGPSGSIAQVVMLGFGVSEATGEGSGPTFFYAELVTESVVDDAIPVEP